MNYYFTTAKRSIFKKDYTMINILEKIRKYRIERNWSEYQLAEKSELPQSTISSWYRKNQIPTIQSLDKICSAFNISLSQFLIEDDITETYLTEEQKELLLCYAKLSKEQQEALIDFLKAL